MSHVIPSSHEFLMMICNTTGNAYIFGLSVIRTQDIPHQSGEGLLCWRHSCLQLDVESAVVSMLVLRKRGKVSIETCALRRLWQSCNRNRMQCPTQPNPFCPFPRFQAAIRKYGVPDEEIFQTADLFERRNVAQVTLCIFALARIVS